MIFIENYHLLQYQMNLTTKIKQYILETDKTTEDTSDKDDVIEVEEREENEIADADILFIKSKVWLLLIELYNVVHGNVPNSEEMDIAVNVCEDNAMITGGTKTKNCVDHERITQVIMAKKLSVDHEMVAQVAQLQIIEQRDEFNQANRTDDIPNVRATLASIVASIPYHISVLMNLKEQTLKEIAVLNQLIMRDYTPTLLDTSANVFDEMIYTYPNTFTLNFKEYEELTLGEMDELNQENRSDDISNFRATLVNIVASIPFHISFLFNLKDQTLEKIAEWNIAMRRDDNTSANVFDKLRYLSTSTLNLKKYEELSLYKASSNLILLQKENSKVVAMLRKEQILNYFLKADINEQNSEMKTKQDCKKKLVGAKYTNYLQLLEYSDKHFFKTLDNKTRATILDGYKDTYIEQEPYTTTINTHARTMEKQNKTSKTAKEPRREKMPSKTRVYSSQPDGGSIEILDGRYLADLLLLLKDRPHVVFPASHPLLMAKFRFIGQSSELNTFLHRIRSFVLGENPGNVSWPDDAMVRPLPLACSGFSYEGNGKEIVCKYCGFKTDTDSWNDNNEKYGMSIHRRAGPFCPFMTSFIDSEVVIPEDDEELDQEQFQVNTLHLLFCRPETCFQDIKILNTFFTRRRIQYSQPIITEELVDNFILNECDVKQKHMFDKYFSNDKKKYRKNM